LDTEHTAVLVAWIRQSSSKVYEKRCSRCIFRS